MTLKEVMTSDLSVFFNTDEFADSITIGGQTVDALVDFNIDIFGLDAVKGEVMVPVASLSSPPSYRSAVVISGTTYYVYRDERNQVYRIEEGMYIFYIYNDERGM